MDFHFDLYFVDNEYQAAPTHFLGASCLVDECNQDRLRSVEKRWA